MLFIKFVIKPFKKGWKCSQLYNFSIVIILPYLLELIIMMPIFKSIHENSNQNLVKVTQCVLVTVYIVRPKREFIAKAKQPDHSAKVCHWITLASQNVEVILLRRRMLAEPIAYDGNWTSYLIYKFQSYYVIVTFLW